MEKYLNPEQMKEFYEQAADIVSIRRGEPMNLHTTFKTGGGAAFFAEPADSAAVEAILKLCRSFGVPFFILGCGSNVLVSDSGYKGLIVSMRSLKEVRFTDGILSAGAGLSLAALAAAALSRGLSGLEFASGIPGSVGGAVFMNAGAYGGEINDVFEYALVLDSTTGEIRRYNREQMEFSYRHSSVMQSGGIILEAGFKLNPNDPSEIKEKMHSLNARRAEKQPLEFPSAGSVFKRPVNAYAGELIEKSGLKGERIGGASVSEKHAGFIINDKNGTSSDIFSLIKYVQKSVFDAFGVKLECEIRFLGEFE